MHVLLLHFDAFELLEEDHEVKGVENKARLGPEEGVNVEALLLTAF